MIFRSDNSESSNNSGACSPITAIYVILSVSLVIDFVIRTSSNAFNERFSDYPCKAARTRTNRESYLILMPKALICSGSIPSLAGNFFEVAKRNILELAKSPKSNKNVRHTYGRGCLYIRRIYCYRCRDGGSCEWRLRNHNQRQRRLGFPTTVILPFWRTCCVLCG